VSELNSYFQEREFGVGNCQRQSVLPHPIPHIMRRSYVQKRTRGGIKGLGTGARSYVKGSRKFQNILQPIPNDGRRLRAETKCCDVESITFLLSTTMSLQYLNLIQEGASFYQRIGRKISMKSIYLTGYIYPVGNNAAALVEDYNRIIVFYDRQPGGANINY